MLGHPIAHSKSPDLQLAAYRELGVDWSYERIDMDASGIAGFVTSRTPAWRGLSLTMPLKRDVVPVLDSLDEVAALTGAANTVVFGENGIHGMNTDVFGIVSALGSTDVSDVLVLGSGATAGSLIVALGELGAARVVVAARAPERAAPLAVIAERIGLDVTVTDLATPPAGEPTLVVSTLPGGTSLPWPVADAHIRSSTLFDVAYDPWPSALASTWSRAGRPVISGLEMLVAQALGQVRVFVSGDPTLSVTDEPSVLAAMRASVDLDGPANAAH
ncbi:shikimate dehydrogenase [Marisediminicola sp. LYQ134]|uniref:shikimate dehydrogenase n=1 Tax=unclassified Marisediminicola TaxID=2618316 RepID=UPI003982FCE1